MEFYGRFLSNKMGGGECQKKSPQRWNTPPSIKRKHHMNSLTKSRIFKKTKNTIHFDSENVYSEVLSIFQKNGIGVLWMETKFSGFKNRDFKKNWKSVNSSGKNGVYQGKCIILLKDYKNVLFYESCLGETMKNWPVRKGTPLNYVTREGGGSAFF